ncbi:MAG: hypothetical protein MJ154_03045 [Candidatus Saccharibacteria bacterium]|nr:hypothetical protein [Candidatus Saccharibacteria bacterium]
MKNIRRIVVVHNNGCNGWSESENTTFSVEIMGDILRVRKISGRDMFPSEINTAVGRILAMVGPVKRYCRSYRYRFCYRTGMSGCQDTFIEIDRVTGYPDRKLMFHESCYGKCSGFSCFVYDFLDLCLSVGFLDDVNGEYFYDPDEDGGSGVNMRILRPRDTSREEGWNGTKHGEIHAPVYLRTVLVEDGYGEEPSTSCEGDDSDEGDIVDLC